MSKQTAVEWLLSQFEEYGYDGIVLENVLDQAKQMEKEQQESEQIELIKWMQDSLGAKEFYVAYEAEELLEKFKKK